MPWISILFLFLLFVLFFVIFDFILHYCCLLRQFLQSFFPAVDPYDHIRQYRCNEQHHTQKLGYRDPGGADLELVGTDALHKEPDDAITAQITECDLSVKLLVLRIKKKHDQKKQIQRTFI